MRVIIIFILTSLISSDHSIAQEQRKDVNFVIVIDEKVLTGAMTRFKIIFSLENGAKETIEADYSPGNLSLKQSDYDKLLSADVKTTFLAFDYTEHCKKNQSVHNYEIDIKKGWLEHYYYVLYIYNTDKKQFKNVYDPLEGKNYTFEFDYPGGSTKRVKKKGAKDDCN
jgi:hypothetical protein